MDASKLISATEVACQQAQQLRREKMTKVRVAFIGAGGMANQVHYPSLSEMPDVEIAAVCDLNEGRLRQTGDRYRISRRYTDYRRMLEEVELDAVYVIMAPKPLAPIVLDCLAQGKHVFTEKPPGFCLEDTRRMAQAAREHGCKTMFGVNRRWAPVVVEARRRVAERGPITLAVGEFHKYHLGMPPIYESYSWLPVDIIHTVDTLIFLGGQVDRIGTNSRRVFDSECTNVYTVLFSFADGGCGVLCANYASGARHERFEVHGRGIAAYIHAPDEAQILRDGGTGTDFLHPESESLSGPELAGSDAFHRTYGYFQESRHFIDCIKGDREPDTNFEYGVGLMQLLERIDERAVGCQGMVAMSPPDMP